MGAARLLRLLRTMYYYYVITIIILKNIFNINAILMLINGCHGRRKTEDAEEKDASIE